MKFKDEDIIKKGGNYELLNDLHLDYFDFHEGMVDILVPKGHVTDLSSINSLVKIACPIKDYIKTYIVYDYLLTHPEFKRKNGLHYYKEEIDILLYDCIDSAHDSWWKKFYVLLVIRFNFFRWKKHRK